MNKSLYLIAVVLWFGYLDPVNGMNNSENSSSWFKEQQPKQDTKVKKPVVSKTAEQPANQKGLFFSQDSLSKFLIILGCGTIILFVIGLAIAEYKKRLQSSVDDNNSESSETDQNQD